MPLVVGVLPSTAQLANSLIMLDLLLVLFLLLAISLQVRVLLIPLLVPKGMFLVPPKLHVLRALLVHMRLVLQMCNVLVVLLGILLGKLVPVDVINVQQVPMLVPM